MFDPEAVERLDDIDIVRGTKMKVTGSYVNSDDFDALLALYRELQNWADDKDNLPQNLWGKKRVQRVVAEQRLAPGWVRGNSVTH
jgi:hypothetical protein